MKRLRIRYWEWSNGTALAFRAMFMAHGIPEPLWVTEELRNDPR